MTFRGVKSFGAAAERPRVARSGLARAGPVRLSDPMQAPPSTRFAPPATPAVAAGALPPLARFVARDLVWRRVHWLGRRYELRAGEEVVARLAIPRFLHRRAEGETAEGRWIHRVHGWARTRVEVLADEGADPIAEFRSGWLDRAGSLRFRDGREFAWVPEGWIRPTWCFLDPRGVELVAMRSRLGFRGLGGDVVIQASAREAPELGLLVTLGWFVLVLQARRSAS